MKIALIGGGSLTWTPGLVTDLALTPEIHGADLALQDINSQSLERMLPLCRLICREAKSQIRVQATLERKEALRLDPAVRDWASAEPMLDEMLAATAQWLPQFQCTGQARPGAGTWSPAVSPP